MDTIDSTVLGAASIVLPSLGFRIIHTVTITLNDAHAELTVEGFDDEDDLGTDRKMTVVLR